MPPTELVSICTAYREIECRGEKIHLLGQFNFDNSQQEIGNR